MPRRARFDPLAPRPIPHWITVADAYGQAIRCDPLPPGADLREAMGSALAQLTADGWRAEGDYSHGFVFCSGRGGRLLVTVTPVDPGMAPSAGHAFLAGDGAQASAY